MITRREALRTFAAGAALGAAASGAAYATTPTPSDPCLAFIEKIEAVEREMADVETIEQERSVLARYNPLCARIHRGDIPAATTAEGAAKALQRVIDTSDWIDPTEKNLVAAALAFLRSQT